ncbi:21954_t:CDS:1 [Cetraspora pellucida]|uniref:21954_t:CDS:1 n=1 Tax=Cetraspora pellucida TaxID=1433469 RepID=A0A9N9FGD2_9GLOM|nr:21954_t:CDS:1 [Cetraspora pellucida]
MSSVKKHKQESKNQRSFRERLRSLEDKAKMYEKAYVDSQNENKLLKEEVEILKRRLSRFEKSIGFEGSSAVSTTIYAAQNMIEESQMNNQIHHGTDDVIINDETIETN